MFYLTVRPIIRNHILVVGIVVIDIIVHDAKRLLSLCVVTGYNIDENTLLQLTHVAVFYLFLPCLLAT